MSTATLDTQPKPKRRSIKRFLLWFAGGTATLILLGLLLMPSVT